MAKETKILKLYQVTRPEDDDKAFNIQTMLNDNWDKIDKAFEKASTAEAEEGTNTEKIMTPKTTKDAILKLAPQLEYKDVYNLSATPSGVISWNLPLGYDNTRYIIRLFIATKDISNFDYNACVADPNVTYASSGKDSTSYTYSGLSTNTQYWVKVYVEYIIGGKGYYSNGVTVTFTTQAVTITEFYNAGNEFTTVTGGWIQSKNLTPPNSYFIKNSNDIAIGITTISGSAFISTTRPTNKIDFTNLSKIKVECESYDGIDVINGTGHTFIAITDNSDGWDGALAFAINRDKEYSRRIFEINTANITGLHYFGISAVGSGEIGIKRNIKIYRVWGES